MVLRKIPSKLVKVVSVDHFLPSSQNYTNSVKLYLLVTHSLINSVSATYTQVLIIYIAQEVNEMSYNILYDRHHR